MRRLPPESGEAVPLTTCLNGATTKPYPLQEDIRVAAAAGFDAVEIWWGKLQDFLAKWSPAELRQLLAGAGLQAAAICPLFPRPFGPDPHVVPRFQAAAEVAAEVGCPTIVVPPQPPPAGMALAEARRRLAEHMRTLCEAVSPFGVRLALEPVGRHPLLPGPAAAMDILEQVDHPAAALMMDTFHYYRSGVTLAELAAIPKGCLAIVHVNGCEDRPLAELSDAHRLYPMQGPIPAVAMLQAVLRQGFRGPVSVETFRPEYWGQSPDHVAVQARAALADLLVHCTA